MYDDPNFLLVVSPAICAIGTKMSLTYLQIVDQYLESNPQISAWILGIMGFRTAGMDCRNEVEQFFQDAVRDNATTRVLRPSDNRFIVVKNDGNEVYQKGTRLLEFATNLTALKLKLAKSLFTMQNTAEDGKRLKDWVEGWMKNKTTDKRVDGTHRQLDSNHRPGPAGIYANPVPPIIPRPTEIEPTLLQSGALFNNDRFGMNGVAETIQNKRRLYGQRAFGTFSQNRPNDGRDDELAGQMFQGLVPNYRPFANPVPTWRNDEIGPGSLVQTTPSSIYLGDSGTENEDGESNPGDNPIEDEEEEEPTNEKKLHKRSLFFMMIVFLYFVCILFLGWGVALIVVYIILTTVEGKGLTYGFIHSLFWLLSPFPIIILVFSGDLIFCTTILAYIGFIWDSVIADVAPMLRFIPCLEGQINICVYIINTTTRMVGKCVKHATRFYSRDH